MGKGKNVRLLVLSVCLALWGGWALSAEDLSTTEVIPIQTRGGKINARLLRRDKNCIWVLQKVSSGKIIERGLQVGEIVCCEPRTKEIFITASQARTLPEVDSSLGLLQSVVDQYLPYRDLPGIGVDEALIQQGCLLGGIGNWTNALEKFADVLSQTYKSAAQARARMYAGCCYANLGQYDKGLGLLPDISLLEKMEDVWLFNQACLARGKCLMARGRYEEAILTYLQPIVEGPGDVNKAELLEALLAGYAAVGDTNALERTCSELTNNFPATQQRVAAFVSAWKKGNGVIDG